MSPYEALYGVHPPYLLPYEPESSKIQAVDELLKNRDQLVRELRQNLERAQHRMQQKADKHRRELEFAMGDRVWLRLQPYRQTSVGQRACHKLAQKYFGPFEVDERIGAVAYRLKLPAGSKVHPVFHVSLLKPFHGDNSYDVVSLPEMDDDGQMILQPLVVCGVRSIMKGGQPCKEVLVQWKGLPPEDAMWEEVVELVRDYPNFHLEDKVNF